MTEQQLKSAIQIVRIFDNPEDFLLLSITYKVGEREFTYDLGKKYTVGLSDQQIKDKFFEENKTDMLFNL